MTDSTCDSKFCCNAIEAPPGHAERCRELERIVHERSLQPVFQPIVELSSGKILGYEGLIRGPSNSLLHAPVSLFAVAERCGLSLPLERMCRRVTVERFAELQLPGRLFLNVNPDSLLDPDHLPDETRAFLAAVGLQPEQIVIELTETKPDASYPALREATALYREHGFRIALDDLGEGFSNLRMWSEVRPDFVKLDKHFIQGIHLDPLKEQFVRSLVDIARKAGTLLIAEGVEAAAELRVLRRLGVQYAQGYLFARPSAVPALELRAFEGVSWEGAHLRLGAGQNVCARDLLRQVAAVSPELPNEDAYAMFVERPECVAIPVVEHGVPVGMLRRQPLLESFARPFNRELYGKKPCSQLMDRQPLIVSSEITVHELSEQVVAAEQRYLIDGFIIVEDGRYLGMGTGFDLMRKITELQISAARYANPLTGLPGNVPINETADRLIDAAQPFVVAYVDLDNFKPFNDLYGYSAGDELIVLLGQLLEGGVDPARDFVGHIGGDDFVLLMQSADWEVRLENLVASFDRMVGEHFRAEHLDAGGFTVHGRTGEVQFFPLTAISIGVLNIAPGSYLSHHEIASAAAEAKSMAKKRLSGSSIFVERRRPERSAA